MCHSPVAITVPRMEGTTLRFASDTSTSLNGDVSSEEHSALTIMDNSPLSQAIFKPWHPAILSIMIPILILSVPLNLLTLVAYNKFHELHNPTNFLICSQSVGDLLSALTGSSALLLLFTPFGSEVAASTKYACLFALTSSMTTLVTSVCSILLLSMDRFIAIIIPFKYYEWVTDRYVKRVVCIMWAGIIIIQSTPLLGWNTWKANVPCFTSEMYPEVLYQFLIVFPGLICLLLTALANVAIAIVAIRKRKTIVPGIQQGHDREGTKSMTFNETTQYKVTKMLLLVVGYFYLSLLPYLILSSLLSLQLRAWQTSGPPLGVLVLTDFARVLPLTNTIMNSLIYALKNRKFRNAYMKILRRSNAIDVSLQSSLGPS